MTWIFCQCSSEPCGLRFPAETGDARRFRCPRCDAPTLFEPVAPAVDARADRGRLQPLRVEIALLVDNVRSSYNVGSLFRSADGMGAAHLYLCGITPTPDHRGVGKTALGAEEAVDWSYHANGPALVEQLQDAGAEVWVLETGPGAVSLFAAELPLPKQLVLAVGNERAGVDPAIRRAAARSVCLPMLGHKRSLNVASAACAALFWLRFGRPAGSATR